MCYHTSTPSTAQLIKEFKNLQVHYQHEEIFHVTGFTRPYLPVTLNADPSSIVPARWKLIPFWVKTEDDAAKYTNTLNAESESIFEKASYKNYILKNRDLLYVNGFYEQHKVAGQKETENTTSIPQPRRYSQSALFTAILRITRRTMYTQHSQ